MSSPSQVEGNRLRPPFWKAVEVNWIWAKLSSVLISSFSGLEPEPDGHDEDEDSEHPLKGGAGEILRPPGSGPGTEEEAERDQQRGTDVEISLLIVSVGAEQADGQQERAQGR